MKTVFIDTFSNKIVLEFDGIRINLAINRQLTLCQNDFIITTKTKLDNMIIYHMTPIVFIEEGNNNGNGNEHNTNKDIRSNGGEITDI